MEGIRTNGKFTKNDKLSFTDDVTLVVCCDNGSENHRIRAIDAGGKELNSKVFSFENCKQEYVCAKDRMISEEISVFQVKSYAVNTK